MLVIAALALELVITLTDFIEEDMTRRLPAPKGRPHPVGAQLRRHLVLLLPVLSAWAAEETAVAPVFMDCGHPGRARRIGALVFGLRDLAANRRSQRLVSGAAGELVDALREPHTVLLTGATGFIGSRLAEALSAAGHDVIALVRNPKLRACGPLPADHQPRASARRTRIDAIVNLAGEPIANGLWTRAKRRRIWRRACA